jgi:hypothetical protein
MNKNEIRAELLLKGYSIRSWARQHGFCEFTTLASINRYAGTHDIPRGRITFAILVRLSRTVGKEIVPGLFAQNKAA